MENADLEALVSFFQERWHYFETFGQGVVARFAKDPILNGAPPIIHSIKSRMKDPAHLREKLRRKSANGGVINISDVHERITDIIGVRVIHLYQQDFSAIHSCVNDQVGRGDWVLAETPKAYTWDPESREFFEKHGLQVEVKDSFYTSIHYVIRPRAGSEVACEVQVRTLFEEIWAEIDHEVNYPSQTTNLACREQLRVLARLVGAGSRLADAIYRVHREKRSPSDPVGQGD